LLARRSISPGEIDSVDGENLRKAILEFRRQQNLSSGEELDQTICIALHADNPDKPVCNGGPRTMSAGGVRSEGRAGGQSRKGGNLRTRPHVPCQRCWRNVAFYY
jgi:hypothetical protein